MTSSDEDCVPVPYGNMRFRLEIEGVPGSGAVEVVLPEARITRTGQRRRRVQFGALVLRRGLTASPDWYAWWDAARRERQPPRRAVRVVLLDGAGTAAKGWRFTGAVPVAYQLSPLDAGGDAAVIESLELSVADFAAEDEVSAASKPARSRAGRPSR